MIKFLSFLLIFISVSINSHSLQGDGKVVANEKSSPAINEKALIINTFLIPLMVESKTKGIFIDLTRELAKRAGINIDINILPAKRAINDFNLGNADALFPALNAFFPDKKSFLPTEEIIYIKRDIAFTLKGQELIETIAQLEGKKIGITRGYAYADEVINNPNIDFFMTNSDEYSAKMLKAGHIDAFIAEEISGLTALKRMKLKNEIQYSSKRPISESDVFYATQATEQGRYLAELLSQQLRLMKEDGSFNRIMSQAHD